MLRELTGRNVFVTGGNSGIGKAIVEEFANEGASKIVFTYRKPENAGAADLWASHVSRTYRCEVRAIQMDVTNDDHQNKALEFAQNFFKGLPDILINNAGIIDRNSFLDVPRENAVKVMETNFFGPFFLTQKVARLWAEAQKEEIKANRPLKDYTVISVGSISGIFVTGMESYEASKAALEIWMRGLSYSQAALKIRAVTVGPGLVPTKLNTKIQGTADWDERVAAIPAGRAGKPSEIAALVVHVARNGFIYETVYAGGGRILNPEGWQLKESITKMRAKL